LHLDVKNPGAYELSGGVGLGKIEVDVVLTVGDRKSVDHARAEIRIVAAILIQTLIGRTAHCGGNGAYIPPVVASVSLPDLAL